MIPLLPGYTFPIDTAAASSVRQCGVVLSSFLLIPDSIGTGPFDP